MQSRRQFLAGLASVPALGAIPRPVAAMAPEVFSEGGVAIRGADVVAYFQSGHYAPGDPGHALMWRGAQWYFASDANRDVFEMDPNAFAPRYGGYCAYAMAERELVPTDPAAFTVHEGRLYLTHSMNVRRLWRADMAHYIHLAEVNWPLIRQN